MEERMNNHVAQAPAWLAQFLSTLIVTGSVRQALDEAQIDFDTAWKLRQDEEDFAFYWDRALRAHRHILSGRPYWDSASDKAALVN
jgi:hypothetical protein